MRRTEEEEDEAQTLEEQNKQLRLELENLKARVELLREQRAARLEEEDTATASASTTEEDQNEKLLLKLENDLLRAQLKEQQAFLEGCRLLAIPLQPKTSLDSQAELMRQGAENALTQLFLLVSQCQIASDFQPMKLPEHCFQSAIPGLTVTCCIRKKEDTARGVSAIAMRVDGCFPNISPEHVADGYWSTWTNAEAYAETFNGFFDRSSSSSTAPSSSDSEQQQQQHEGIVTGKTPVPFVLRPLLSERHDDRETVVNLYREFPSGAAEPEDWVYCLTKVQREIALSTLSMAAELNPGVTTRRDQHTRRVLPQTASTRVRKRAKGSSSAAQLMGKQECIILARNTMRGIDSPPTLPKGRAVDTRERRTVEGLYVWQDEVRLDSQVQCAEGREILRTRVPAARATAFVTFSSDLRFVQDTDLLGAVVDAQGKATERFSKLIDAYYSRLGRSAAS